MQQRHINMRLLMIAAPVVLAMMVISQLHKRPKTVDSGYRPIMGTFARILVVAPNRPTALACIEAGFAQQQQVDGLMSTYRPDSEISIVNEEAYQRPVPVSPATFTVLQKAIEISRLSQGRFDVTVGPLIALWRSAADANTPPLEEAISQARASVGWEKLILDPNTSTIRFTVANMKIDLGGIAKGYAIDRAVTAMRAAGGLGGMVDIGGDICCFGTPPYGNAHWRIGLQDPRLENPAEQGQVLLTLKLNDRAVATSGHYRRFTLIDGQRTSHIVDIDTGHGSHKLTSTTVIAPDALTADALATAVSVLGQTQGLALIEDLEGVEAMVIPPTEAKTILQPIFSTGAQAFLLE
ncbi:FAD:protein FMN transferase [Planctomycetota bacterium]